MEQIVAKLREAERPQAQGQTIAQVCKRLGISDQTFFRIKYGALKEDRAAPLDAALPAAASRVSGEFVTLDLFRRASKLLGQFERGCFFADFLAAEPDERTLERLVDHIEHFASLIGEDRVALGPDWCDYALDIIRPLSGLASRSVDTFAGYARGLEDAHGLRRLEQALSERGLSASRIMSENALTFLRTALSADSHELASLAALP